MNSFSHFYEDASRLPEGMQRIAYDTDTQRYTFRDRSGQLYQGAPGEEYGVLRPVAAPLPHRRSVTVTEIPDPALREWSRRQTAAAKTFDDILPSGYITAAKSTVGSPTAAGGLSPREKLVQVAVPKLSGVVESVRRRTTRRRNTEVLSRAGSITDDRRRLLEDGQWDVVRKDDAIDGRLARSKTEIRPSRYFSRK